MYGPPPTMAANETKRESHEQGSFVTKPDGCAPSASSAEFDSHQIKIGAGKSRSYALAVG
jgi:hypothetical protein